MNALWLTRFGAVLGKDLRVELRTREILSTSLLFAVVVVVLFVFSGFTARRFGGAAGPGVLWTTLAFTGSLIFSRTFQREREGQAIDGILMVPGMVGPLFAGKLAINALLLGLVELLLVPAVMGVFRLDLSAAPLPVAGALALGTIGYASLGTVLAASLATVRLREVLLPLVLFPLCIPLLVGGVRATALALAGDSAAAGEWVLLMLAFDALFIALGRWLFGEAVDA